MKVLLIGSGGREHALAWKLCQSANLSKLYVASGSDAIRQEGAELVELSNQLQQVSFAKEVGIDLVVIGPETPLVEGLADAFRAANIAVFGPNAKAAQLEGSKWFAKTFMQRHGIPTAKGESFTELSKAEKFLKQMSPPYVLKADGLAAGKGVSIHHQLDEARQMLVDIFAGRFGIAGQRVLIEEFLVGQEASCFVFTDGKHCLLSPASQDHKPVFNNDQGPNTGGMGAYAPAPLITPAITEQVLNTIVKPTLKGLQAENILYQGVIYLGLMIQENKLSVVEYNCRFGDPECQPLMMLLASDLLTLLYASATGTLHQVKPEWQQGTAACVVMASEGYPNNYKKGLVIEGLTDPPNNPTEQISPENAVFSKIFHAGTLWQPRQAGDANDFQWHTNGGRVLGVCVKAETLEKALKLSYDRVNSIRWQGVHYRTDIGQKAFLS